MKAKSILKNNKGGGLILVVGCVALLSLIGAMLLVVTNNNRKMKDLELQMQQSFYGAESGADEMVSQLEIEAEDAVKRAFEDLMVQYSLIDTPDARNTRFAEFFLAALKDKMTGPAGTDDKSKAIMSKALGVPEADLDVDVSFGEVENVSVLDAEGFSVLRIKDATFTYTANGSQTKITTDINIKTKVPNVDSVMTNSVACDFTDFALIAGEDANNVSISTPLNNSQTAYIEGNLYSKGHLLHSAKDMIIKVVNADKFLVARDLKVSDKAIMKIEGGAQTSGDGMWANGVEVSNGGILNADSNFYVSDDLTISGNNTKVKIKGGEYIGYSGAASASDESGKNSAITINTAKNITLDMSETTDLVLNGSSYIHDALWGEISDAYNALGILQGESVAYKDMQSMYLVPGECLISKHNPMTLNEYNTASANGTASVMTGAEITYQDTSVTDGDPTRTFSFRPYLAGTPSDTDTLTQDQYVVRHVKLDGGATEFVYIYMKFDSAKSAQEYFKAYMAIEALREPMKKRLKDLGNSTIKLAQNNYTLANAFYYNSADDTYGVEHATTSFSYLGSNSMLAQRRTGGLFTHFRLDASSTYDRNFDIITNKIVRMDRFDTEDDNTWNKRQFTVGGVTYDFWVYDGDAVIETDEPSTNKGIILVNGKLSIKNSDLDFNGLVLATKGVEFVSGAELYSNSTAVEALLTVPEVQQYFYANGGGTEVAPYISSEAVTISFDNWKKN